MPVKRQPNFWIITFTVALILIGMVMIFSSSAVIADERYSDPYYFLKRQTAWILLGFIGMAFITRIDYRSFQKYAYVIYGAVVISLIITLIPGIGHTVNGAQRWIRFGAMTIQPAEFAKLGMIIFFAAYLSKKETEGKIRDFTVGFLPCVCALTVVSLLILFQPDLGNAMIIAIVSFFMFLVAGMRKTYLVGTIVFALPFLAASIYNVDYRKRRILSFLNPWDDASDSGYQIIQSFVAMSNGGFFGMGLGAGSQKLFFLPEPHTDFIFSIIGEELGFLGGFTVMVIFAALAIAGLKVGMNAPDRFGSYLALGIIFAMSLQVLINLSVVLGMAPTKGLPLPFISLGGSALTMWMLSIGLLLNVSEHTK